MQSKMQPKTQSKMQSIPPTHLVLGPSDRVVVSFVAKKELDKSTDELGPRPAILLGGDRVQLRSRSHLGGHERARQLDVLGGRPEARKAPPVLALGALPVKTLEPSPHSLPLHYITVHYIVLYYEDPRAHAARPATPYDIMCRAICVTCHQLSCDAAPCDVAGCACRSTTAMGARERVSAAR